MNLEINPQFEFARGFLENIESHFASEKETIHLGRNTIKKLSFETHNFIVKSFGVPNIINLLVYGLFRDSKAKRSYQNAHDLINAQIPTAIPVACSEQFRMGFLRQSYFVALKVDYDYDFHDINFERKIGKPELFRQFAEFSFRMHQAGFLHLDYTPGNILIKEKLPNYEFTVIDINRMRIGPVSWQEGAESLGKIYFKEPWMEIVASRYAELANIPKEEVEERIQKSRNAFERKKNLKKTLRFWKK
jgi:hypothetical protein